MSISLPVYLCYNPSQTIVPVGIDWIWLIVLAFFCTVILYLLYISALKKLSAFTASLAGNLEPVYGIFFAMLFFNEAQYLSLSFYVGMTLILLSVFSQSFAKNKIFITKK